VRDNLFVIRGGGGNTAVFVGADGVTLVDTKIDTFGWTGLHGYYALTLRYAGPSGPNGDGAAATSGDAPSLFTAVEEQFGLTLEPARKLLQTVAIDHIEATPEN